MFSEAHIYSDSCIRSGNTFIDLVLSAGDLNQISGYDRETDADNMEVFIDLKIT